MSGTVPITAPIPDLDIGSELVGYNLVTSFNLGHAQIEGIELGGQYRCSFLPAPFSNLDLFANYTRLLTTEGTFNPAAPGSVYDSLPQLAREMWNGGFKYSTPNGKLFLKLSANFVDDLPQNIITRQFKDSRLVYDAEIRYNFTPHYTLSLSGRNITEAEEGEHLPVGAIRTGTGGGAALTLTLALRY